MQIGLEKGCWRMHPQWLTRILQTHTVTVAFKPAMYAVAFNAVLAVAPAVARDLAVLPSAVSVAFKPRIAVAAKDRRPV